jgi:periplasmic divalent cation tolerance protein
MIMKSRANLLDEIVKTVKSNHPYEVPEVIATNILGGNQDYINWVLENTKEPDLNQEKKEI